MLLRDLLDRFVWSWDRIHNLGRLGVFKSAFVFLGLLPATVQFTAAIRTKYDIVIEPPFSWFLLFFSALAVSCGNLVYYWRCPLLVKKFRDFLQFRETGRDRKYFLVLLHKLWNCPIDAKAEVDSTEFDNWMAGLNIGSDIKPRVRYHETMDHQAWQELGSDDNAPITAKTFYFFRDLANIERGFSRILCSLLYVIGFALVAIVLAQNVWSVYRWL